MTTASEYGGQGALLAREAQALAGHANEAARAELEQAQAEAKAATLSPRPSAIADNLPKPGDLIAGRYKLDQEIGRGAMGVIYSATQVSSGRRIAVKWLFESKTHKNDRRRRFLREARAASSIQHTSIVRVYDAGKHADGVFLVMELLQGESLRLHMLRNTFSVAAIVDLLMPALRGIAAAHRKGIIHRDLKPDNMLVCPQGGATQPQIKVLDFGLSKLVGADADSLHTMPGAMLGTPQYMAPEQAGGAPIDARADVYSLGVILYEAIAGRRPFEALTLAGLLLKLARDEPPHLRSLVRDVPIGFANAVMRALQRDPNRRQRSVDELARDLEPYGTLPFLTYEAERPAADERPLPWRSRFELDGELAQRAAWLVVAAGVSFLLGLGARHFLETAPVPHAPIARTSASAIAPAPRPEPAPRPTRVAAPPAPVKAALPEPDARIAPTPAAVVQKKRARHDAKRSTAPPSAEVQVENDEKPARPGVVDPWEDVYRR